MPDVVEWGLCIFNCLFWGITVAFILNYHKWNRRPESG